ncbi:hypothetical protein PanWU01x14_260710 [Parasponia andersonii]|uniref:Uncharacterized protein n=1 Tax=Parasponia andersonii TaxID=3476 RepID=A0A2P5B903_PARAD|nr:hypothetical protein PanWU01x14_260710 [Parasponia andersonii]
MASMHCYKPANETGQQKCLEKCYGHGKPNDTGSYYSGQSLASNVNSALYGQTYNCPDRNMASKPNMNSSYGYLMITDQYHPVAKPCPTQTPTMGHVAHGQCNQGHGHSHVGKQCGTSHGKMASCHGKSHEKKKADHCNNKKDKSHKMKNKHKDCNRSCSDSSDSSSDSDCN